VNLVLRRPPALFAGIATAMVAAGCWIVLLAQGVQMGGRMAMSTFGAFIATWIVMMAAMMLPSVVPFVSDFAGAGAGRWPAAAVILVVEYLAVWAVFGAAAYLAFGLVPQAWMGMRVVAGAAIIAAGVYSLTPFQRGCSDRCRAMCREAGPSAPRAGAVYALNCVGCSAFLMVALLVLGISNLVWMVVVAALVFAYKVLPRDVRLQNAIAIGMVAFGLGFALLSIA
jgi:predicted metal-binding membrane protein